MELAIICIVESKVKIVCNMGLLQMVSEPEWQHSGLFSAQHEVRIFNYLFIYFVFAWQWQTRELSYPSGPSRLKEVTKRIKERNIMGR